jgi:hypothetical protein
MSKFKVTAGTDISEKREANPRLGERYVQTAQTARKFWLTGFFCLLDYYAAWSCIKPTFRKYLSVPYSRVTMSKKHTSSCLLLEHLDPWKWNRQVLPKRRFQTTSRHVITHKTEEFSSTGGGKSAISHVINHFENSGKYICQRLNIRKYHILPAELTFCLYNKHLFLLTIQH